jgi:hypothetical protein
MFSKQKFNLTLLNQFVVLYLTKQIWKTTTYWTQKQPIAMTYSAMERNILFLYFNVIILGKRIIGKICGQIFCKLPKAIPYTNRDIGNKVYTEKVAIFETSGFEMTKKINYPEWNANSLDKRQADLAKIATSIWRIISIV